MYSYLKLSFFTIDPYDCRGYYVCSWNADKSAIIFIRRACASTEVFSEATGACVASTQCVTVDCKVKMGNEIFSPYGTSTKYYALCTTKDGVTTIKMFQCATGATFDKTPSVSKCIYKCPAVGKFVYSLDNKKYYNCVRGTNGLITPTIVSCATAANPTSIFVPADKDCGFPAVSNPIMQIGLRQK